MVASGGLAPPVSGSEPNGLLLAYEAIGTPRGNRTLIYRLKVCYSTVELWA